MLRFRLVLLVVLLFSTKSMLRGDVALLLEEPYGHFGALNPTGHAAVYLSGICAASFTRLRPCNPGEPGVVISRYHRIAGYDWIAMPPAAYLYAVEDASEAPVSAGEAEVARLRDRYRRAHLRELIPDGPGGEPPTGDWVQLAGEAYERKIYGFQFRTTPEQDLKLIARLNDRPNRTRFHLLFRNCADFARAAINTFFPGALHRSLIADAGVTTPKQIAKSLVKYARKHPELDLFAFVIPQIPGTVERSKHVRGVLESLIRTKKYVVPLAALHPWVAGSIAAAYLTRGRFNPSNCGPVLEVHALPVRAAEIAVGE